MVAVKTHWILFCSRQATIWGIHCREIEVALAYHITKTTSHPEDRKVTYVPSNQWYLNIYICIRDEYFIWIWYIMIYHSFIVLTSNSTYPPVLFGMIAVPSDWERPAWAPWTSCAWLLVLFRPGSCESYHRNVMKCPGVYRIRRTVIDCRLRYL